MRPSTRDFHDPDTQLDILLNGCRDDIIQWLAWNDRNGVWSDEDSAAEGWKPITLEESRACMRKMLSRSPSDPAFACPKLAEFDPNLPVDADEEVCKTWLRKLCRDFGLGFHPDTPASDYVSREGVPLPPEVVVALDDSMERAFEELGDEVYVVCAEVAEVMMAEWLGPLDYDCSE